MKRIIVVIFAFSSSLLGCSKVDNAILTLQQISNQTNEEIRVIEYSSGIIQQTLEINPNSSVSFSRSDESLLPPLFQLSDSVVLESSNSKKVDVSCKFNQCDATIKNITSDVYNQLEELSTTRFKWTYIVNQDDLTLAN